MIVLGIDPGTAITGYGMIKTNRRKEINKIEYGTIRTSFKKESPERLKILYNRLTTIINKYHPNVMVVEKLYFFKNLKTVMQVSQAKGVILLAGAKKKIPIIQITPLQSKMAMTGYGRANKKQVQKTVKNILKLDKIPSPDDAADALALAITYLRSSKALDIKMKRDIIT